MNMVSLTVQQLNHNSENLVTSQRLICTLNLCLKGTYQPKVKLQLFSTQPHVDGKCGAVSLNISGASQSNSIAGFS